MKTTKSFTKRLKITKNGKIVGRKPGQNHFNAKANRRSQLDRRRSQPISFSKKVLQRYIDTVKQ